MKGQAMGGGGGGYFRPVKREVETYADQCVSELYKIEKWALYVITSCILAEDISSEAEAIASDFKEVVVHMTLLDERFGNWQRQQKRRRKGKP